jgi:hypothetical protein
MEHLGLEDHFRRLVGELEGEAQSGFVESALEGRVLRSLEADAPLEEVIVLEADGDGEVGLALLGN